MDDTYFKKIFSKNLNKYLELAGKNQIDLINDLGFNKSAVSTWCNGTRLPRMDKINTLAHYFGINNSDLLEEPRENLHFDTTEDNTRYTRIHKMLSNGEEVSPDDIEYFRSETAATIKKVPDVFKKYADELEEIHLQAMVDDYKLLNADGKAEARKRVEELTYIPRYTAASGNITPAVPTEPFVNAAHAIPGASEEDKGHDEAIMNDDSEWK